MTRRVIIVVLATLALACGDATDAPPAAHADARRAVVAEERDGLWLTDASGARRRVTATRVGPFDYDSLAAKQREGEVILYWAAAPVLSPDGERIAYATNREAVAADTSGQSIWLLDLSSGAERAVLHVPGRSFRPVGWLERRVVYFGDEPGVWTIDPASGERTRISRGTWLAATGDGGALAVAENVPDDPALRVITNGDTLDVPRAPAGFVYLAQAAFDSANRRLLLEATPDSGYTRRRFAFDLRRHRLEPLD